ncbi:MAG: hypothetical protein NTX79_01540 [Candidatus Micrarchaeota archaeon]|nr:hypothetical protein [Candidatus Micrarchaeota archaeon]
MASAVQAFSDAFSSYRALVVEYAVYSVILIIASMALSFFAGLCLGIFGIVSLGSVANVFASDGSMGIAAIGLGVSLIALFLALLAVLWVSSGLHGAYLSTLNGFISRRNQSLGAFFLCVPKFATSITLISIICGVLVGAPLLFVMAIAPSLGEIFSILALLLVLIYVAAAAFLLVFAMPAAVVDGKGPISAIKVSAIASLRNPAQVIIYFAIAFALAIPALVPLFNLLYIPLFYMPLSMSALLRLYRTAH